MDKSQIITLALNILSTNSAIRTSDVNIPEMKPCILCKEKFIPHPDGPIKEFTMASCGCIFHQKCFEGHLLDIAKDGTNATCFPTYWKDCKVKDIETLISQDLFKETDKPTTSTAEDTATNQMDSENPTRSIRITGRRYDIKDTFSSSKTTKQASSSIETAKETADQTRAVENTSSASNNPEILNENSSRKFFSE